MALESTRTTSKTVRDCKRVLKQAKENHRIAIRWIKGHDDHTGNELADHLARTGSETKTLDCYPTIPVPKSFISLKLKDHFTARYNIMFGLEVLEVQAVDHGGHVQLGVQ